MNFDKQGHHSGVRNSILYWDKLKRGLEQVHAGLGIKRTMGELEGMEKDES